MSESFDDDVFLSHRAKDKTVVRPLAERLRKDGVKVWFDEWVLKPGGSIESSRSKTAKIEEGLERSRSACRPMRSARTGRSWSPARPAEQEAPLPSPAAPRRHKRRRSWQVKLPIRNQPVLLMKP